MIIHHCHRQVALVLAANGSQRCTSPTTPPDVASLWIPDSWRPEVTQAIKYKTFTDSARNEVVRSLVNLLFTVSSKPSRPHCDDLAKKFIMKYPSSKDELGKGYVS